MHILPGIAYPTRNQLAMQLFSLDSRMTRPNGEMLAAYKSKIAPQNEAAGQDCRAKEKRGRNAG